MEWQRSILVMAHVIHCTVILQCCSALCKISKWLVNRNLIWATKFFTKFGFQFWTEILYCAAAGTHIQLNIIWNLMFTLYFSIYLTRQTKVNLKQEITDSSCQINEFIEHRGNKDKWHFSLTSMFSFVFCGNPENGTYSNIYVQCYHKYIYWISE